MSIDCPKSALLADLVLGKLSEPLIDEVVQHASQCDSCASVLETLDGLSDGLISFVRRHLYAPIGGDDSEVLELSRLTARADELCSEFAAEDWGDDDAALPLAPAGGDHIPSLGAEGGAERAVEMGLGMAEKICVGQYTLLERLGQGAMGTVYKARHHKLKRIVALKTLPAHRMRDPQALMRFDREMEAVGKVDHPNVVRATDAGHLEDFHFLVMEYVEGVDLARLVRRLGAIRIADACEVIRQAALALDHAHQRGLVHRDVKPSNLMLNIEGQVKLLDLGLARLLEMDAEIDEAGAGQSGSESTLGRTVEEPTSAGQIIGTRDFMAPEQALDSHDVDARVDIYSLGCTLYKLLTGKAPFEHLGRKDGTVVLRAHAKLSPPPLLSARPDAPVRLAQILDRMLAKRPEERFATAREVAEAVAPFCSGANLLRLSSAARGEIDLPLVDERLAPVWADVIAADRPLTATALRNDKPPRRRAWLIAAIAAGLCSAAAASAGLLLIVWRDEPIAYNAGNRPAAVGNRGVSSADLPNDASQPSATAAPSGEPPLAVDESSPAASGPTKKLQDDNRPSTPVGKERFALRFAGGSQRVEFPGTHELVNLTKAFTLEMWFRGGRSHFEQPLFSTFAAAPPSSAPPWRSEARGWMLAVEDHSFGIMPPTYTFHSNFGEQFPSTSSAQLRFRPLHSPPRMHRMGLPRGLGGETSWRHIAICFNAGQVTVCQDGQFLMDAPGAPLQLSLPAEGQNAAGGDLTLGSAQEILLHSRMYSPTQGLTGDVRALRLSAGVRYTKAFEPPQEFEKEDQTLLLLDFSCGTGDEIPDLSGSGLHGKIIGAQWVPVLPDPQADAATESFLPSVPAELFPSPFSSGFRP